ncbi:hypothetical protein [Agrobacterium tumefaciens]|uniref:hypothetical protein n=1 Tax=Agrobacterium tumefaciens TaxID=358 RepID=UPI00287BE0B2|nr:hypothetical protein [Agrobacterium tumefaciens]MDS7594339.1 hypothetical protein [Agrobacterium tumefaciens]
MAQRLLCNSIGGGLIALLLLAIAPLTAGAHGFTSALGWWLLLAFCLVALALAAHLMFDALLFRIGLSFDTEEAGLMAIDDVLARMGLREKPAAPAALSQRFSGCRRLVLVQWSALSVGIVLYGILLLDAMNGGSI